ncbi:MAG: pyridoxal-phosphate dependent enzyme [Pirellulales bacterium]|nr:pyridoxal-phosphate dependent enzyme [Pirellulales bacterium]
MNHATKTSQLPTIDEIRAAVKRISPEAHRTPILSSSYFNERLGARLFFKCENFQKIGAFKIRGGLNAVRSLSEEEKSRGVVTHSSGNHAQAISLAGRICGVQVTIVMPNNAPQVKKNAVRDYGGQIVECEPNEPARIAAAEAISQDTGATLIHSYNDPRIIAGQGTTALELLEDLNETPDIVMTPVGGGGLLSGTGISVKALSPQTKVVGGEPEMADDAKRSLEAGRIIPVENPQTIADGLKMSLGTLTFAAIHKNVSQIITCSEQSIIDTMKLVWERMKIIIEPSSAVPLAALLEGNLDVRGKTVAIILSGGNVDLNKLPW